MGAVGAAHHITQRGNNRQDVFLLDSNRETLLALLAEDNPHGGLDMRNTQYSRRCWLKNGMTAAAYLTASRAFSKTPVGSKPFLLSEQGCGRATGYAEANKIVTSGDHTHVAWLDSPPEGFRVRVRTLDRRTGEWSSTHTVGEGYDNHGGPALTIDSEGFLHIVYYPHHHAMRYRRSKRPHDPSAWGEEVLVGDGLTYPTLVCGKDNTLYLTARRRFREKPWEVELWKRPPGAAWRRQGSILASRYPGYAHFQESLAWGPGHRTLHLCCRFHENSDKEAYGRLQSVAYMVSHDLGQTWRRGDGRDLTLPVTVDNAGVLVTGGAERQRIVRAGSMAVDRKGRPHLLYSVEEGGRSTLTLARLDGGRRHKTNLSRFVPDKWSSWNLMVAGGVAFNARDETVVVATLQQPNLGDAGWGHPSDEIVALRSRDGGASFSFALVSPEDSEESHWLPNIERPTGHHRVGDDVGVLYTAGGPGPALKDLLSNKVFFARLSP
jgi:hypothetical protein